MSVVRHVAEGFLERREGYQQLVWREIFLDKLRAGRLEDSPGSEADNAQAAPAMPKMAQSAATGFWPIVMESSVPPAT